MTDLHEQLARLYDVQQLDAKALSIHRHTKSVPQEIQKLDSALDKFQQAVEAKKTEISEAEKAQRSIQGEIEQLDEKRNKLTMQMRSVKTNKEYEALDKEIEFLDQKEAELEDHTLGLLERIDQLKVELDETSEQLKIQKTEQKSRKKAYELEKAELTKSIKAMGKQRKILCQDLDRQIFDQYQLWMKRRQATYLAPIIDGACGSCQMKLPPQLAGEIPRRQEIMRCPVCRKVLFSTPEINDEKE